MKINFFQKLIETRIKSLAIISKIKLLNSEDINLNQYNVVIMGYIYLRNIYGAKLTDKYARNVLFI